MNHLYIYIYIMYWTSVEVTTDYSMYFYCIIEGWDKERIIFYLEYLQLGYLLNMGARASTNIKKERKLRSRGST